MATKKQTTTEIPKQFSESASAYLERLEAGHERFAETLSTVRERNARVTDKFVEALIAGQRDALSLGKAFAAEPTAYGKNMEAVMESMSAAQERALDVAKTVYREQAEAGAEFRGMLEKSFESAKVFTKPFEQMTAAWSQAAK